MERLSDEQVAAALAELEGWERIGEAIVRTFRFHDFVGAIDFVNHVAEVAESAQHHPDIDVRYNKVTLGLSTHSAGGVTGKDVELARAIEHSAR